jgi:hypothetical protein
MHSLFGKRGVVLAGLLAIAMGALAPSTAEAKPDPAGKSRGFRLFARSLGAMTINRVYCGLAATGEVCVDSTNSSTIGGGYWPKGTANQYVFNSGLQIAGRIGTDGGPWAGDVTGAFFFDPKGTTQHGEEVVPIYNTSNPTDQAFLADTSGSCDQICQAGKIAFGTVGDPRPGDSLGEIFHPLLRGRAAASQGDVWWVSWDGNPTLNAGRPHPLGVVVEQRGMGWNYPTGNQDIIYFVYTFYNVTSSDPNAYANVRPGMRELLQQKGVEFQTANEEQFGVQIPDGGYTITDMFAAFAADNDVADAGANYSSVNLPFALGYTYEHTFGKPEGWTFDPGIFARPFFEGVGFIGIKYLKSPTGPGAIQLYSNTLNGGQFGDPQNVVQLYRYLSGNIDPGQGDGECNFQANDPRVCYVADFAFDTRFFMSSTPLTLAPGEFQSIVVAYIFAPPAQVASFTAPTGDLKPGNPLFTSRIADLETPGRVNMVDSIAGFRSFLGDGDKTFCADTVQNANGVPDQCEFSVVPGSLLGKANVAQAVFDGRFLLPFAPESPDFFLVPGDNQVSVLWRPSRTEVEGDPFFEIASNPESPLFDPNYRDLDVEGYRVYRGRVDSPNELTLIAQFDYSGTALRDVRGFVQPTPGCAPELGVVEDCAADFLGADPTVSDTNEVPLVGEIIQVRTGGRAALGTGAVVDSIFPLLDTLSGTGTEEDPFVFDTVGFDTTQVFRANAVIITEADTLPTGGGLAGTCSPSTCPALEDNGVPFVYVDRNVRNNFRYFYSVTAFDVNSFSSGPTSLESPRNTKSITPVAGASNFQNTAEITTSVIGRDGQPLEAGPQPTIDPTTGIFSGKFQPTFEAAQLGFVGEFVRQLVATGGAMTAVFDSVVLGSAYEAAPGTYYWTVTTPQGTFKLAYPLVQDVFDLESQLAQSFTAIAPNQALAAQFGGSSQFTLSGQLEQTIAGNYYTSAYGRGCVNGADGFDQADGCSYNGARWFSGANESTPNPTADQGPNNINDFSQVVSPNNAGTLPGVDVINELRAYQNTQTTWRQIDGILGAAARSADFNVYWGAAGKIDSVIDVTYNVPVPFDADTVGATWGVLNQAATAVAGTRDGRPDVLTVTDIGCVAPFRDYAAAGAPGALIGCTAPAVQLSETVVPGQVAIPTTVASSTTVPVQPNPGFVLFMPGHVFTITLEGGALPAAGTVWTLRTYVGAISGGHGGPVDEGDYVFTPATQQFTAVGAGVQVRFDVVNQVVAATKADLERVHTVPDPYYVTNEFEQSTDNKILKFVNLPNRANIRIYSSSGVLVNLIEHNSAQNGGSATWNLRNRNNQVVASGVYFYHVESGDARRVGRFTVVNFAQ